MTQSRLIPIVAALTLVAVSSTSDAQSLRDRIKQRAQESVARKIGQVIECAIGDDFCIKKAKAEGKTVTMIPAATDSAPATPPGAAANVAAAAPSGRPGEGAWVNYDFVPGSRSIFVEDFAKDNVGDFPRRLEFKAGNMEIAAWEGRRILRGTTYDSELEIILPEVLPQQFTIEIDLVPGKKGFPMALWLGEKQGVIGANKENTKVARMDLRHQFDRAEMTFTAAGVQARSSSKKAYPNVAIIPVRIMVDGRYVKAYVDEERLVNVPNATFTRSKTIAIQLSGDATEPALVANIRISAGGKKLYDALAEKGRVATQGIFFDSGSDHIRPESTPTLKEIAAMLDEHPELGIVIEGHTDNVGAAASNQTLSEKRAAAVRQYLIDANGIAAERLSAAGFGATKPAGSNDTPEGRQNNRRVELVKK